MNNFFRSFSNDEIEMLYSTFDYITLPVPEELNHEMEIVVKMKENNGKNKTSRELYVGNLPKDCQNEELFQYFNDHGLHPLSCKVVQNPDGTGRGYGFVTIPAHMYLPLDFGRLKGNQLKISDSYKQQSWNNSSNSSNSSNNNGNSSNNTSSNSGSYYTNPIEIH